MNRKLPDKCDTVQAFRGGAHTSPRVLRLGITASRAEPKGNLEDVTPDRWPRGRDAVDLAVADALARVPPPDPEPDAADLADERAARALHESKVPEWARDLEWTADMEHVWRERVRPEVADLTARAKRYKRAARDLCDVDEFGGRRARLRAPGLRECANTRRALRAQSSRNVGGLYAARCSVTVIGAHGSASPDGRRVELMKASEWAENRARSASMSRVDLVGTCRGRWRKVRCGCGTVELLVGCDQTTLCGWCRRRHWRRWRRRIVRAMGPQLRGARDRWNRKGARGRAPAIYLLTLTMPHSGDLVTDRKTMGVAWRELSKAASYGGYQRGDRYTPNASKFERTNKGLKLARAEGRYSLDKWWGHHAGVYEVTPGTVGDGHMHMHIAVISRWVPYHELRAAWEAAIPGAVIVDVVSPEDARRKAEKYGRKLNGVSNAAEYLSKYVTKGVEPSEMTGRKAGELLVAFRGRRKVTTSRGFWRPLAGRVGCTECNECHRLVEAPHGLQQHAPAAVLASASERSRWRPPRGAPQIMLRWPASSSVA